MLNSAGVSLGKCDGCEGADLVSGCLFEVGDVGGRKRPVLLLVRSEPDKELVVPFGRKSELIVSN